MRLKPPALAYVVVQRLYNRRITVRRDEADGGYQLVFETCLTKADAAERLAAETPDKLVLLRRGRVLVTRLGLSNEAMSCLTRLHKLQAATRQKERSRRQQGIVTRLAATEEATLDAELRAAEPAPPAPPNPKPPRTPRAKKGEK